ncbi:cytochrome c oxidase subunit 3, partial [Acinetobacter baumannii]
EYRHEFSQGYGPATNSFFSLYYFITFAHLLHVIGGSIFMLHCYFRASAETGQESYRRKLENTGLFWHFVDLLWMFIFPLLYLARAA